MIAMQRPVNYSTKQGDAVLAYLSTDKEMFVTASQIAEHLQEEQVVISKPTVYRQLERLVKEGKVRKYLFGDTTVASYQYVDPEVYDCSYHLKCEVCDGVFNMKCDEVDHVSKHILEEHAFQVDGSKTVFYGRCKMCRGKSI